MLSYKTWRSLPMMALILVLALAFGVSAQTHTGAWVDRVIFVQEESQAQAITRLEVGDFDIYAFSMSNADLFQRVKASPFLSHTESFGSYNELSFNPSGPEFADGRLNPFSVPKIREAMNWLIDRDYIVDEIYGGLAVPKFFPITAAFPDYARYAATTTRLELKYAHDPARAEAVISEEMVKLGAERVNGIWHYKGEPVELIVLIRPEDERRDIGDYLSSLLEDIGFEVNRMYRNAGDASPLWFSADPTQGLMHVYTGGWITTAVARDQGDNFAYFYTDLGLATPLWEAYVNDPEFYELADRLDRQDFTTMEERGEMFERALELALEDSIRVWLIDQLSFTPQRAGVQVGADMAGAVAGSRLWPTTLRHADRVGGDITIGMPSLLTEPWNPIGGTNWIYDAMLYRAVGEPGAIPDPYTGLAHPNRFERAEVFLVEGLPVGKTLDWIDITFVPEIQVPGDAWIDWDPVEQRFITVAEKHPEGLTALRKSVVYYPENLSDVTWHDGSPVTVGDFVLGMILGHDRFKEESAVFDQSGVAAYQASMVAFKGQRIVSTDPLIIEAYGDSYALDAENNVSTFWPMYSFGPGAWHNLAVALLSEANQDTAFTSAKANTLDVDWLSMIAGPSLAALDKHMADAKDGNYIPYANTLGQFVSEAEARERYANLQSFVDKYGHYFIGTGVLMLESVHPVEGSAVLARYDKHIDRADRWAVFAEPMYAEVDVEGTARLAQGRAAQFDVWVTFAGEAYPSDLIADVTYIVIGSNGEVAFSGSADYVAEGLYEVRLSAEQTAQLPVGATQVTAIVVPIPVAKPTAEGHSFVVTP